MHTNKEKYTNMRIKDLDGVEPRTPENKDPFDVGKIPLQSASDWSRTGE